MSSFILRYTWSVPDTFDLNFNWTIIPPPPPPVVPTIVTAGPKNAINRVTLLYPNGNENILTREIEISWLTPSPVSTDKNPIWYEIYFTENYDYFNEPDWKMIASVPSSNKKYLWKVGNSIKSKNVRVGIRGVNSRGERSDMSISAASFSIQKSLPVTPSVLSPISNQRYGSQVKIVFDDSAVLKSFSQRAKYYIYFSSNHANIPYSPVAQNVPVGTGPIIWDTSMLPPSDDYVISVYLADDDGNKSDEINIRNVSIIQEGFFLIDTKPPSGYIQINNSDQFTKDRNVSVRLYAYDQTTGVHSMQFLESDQSDVTGPAESFANLKFWELTDSDGEKTLKVKFQDYGGNRTSEASRSFRILFDINNDEIIDITLQKGNPDIIWLAKNGSQPSIYKFSPNNTFVSNVSQPINSIAVLGGVLYVSVKTDDSTALVYRWTGFVLENALSLSDIDSEVVSMYSFKNSLYLGSKNGNLYKYDENSLSLVKSFSSSIHRLYSDNSLLYIILRNSKNVTIHDGASFYEIST